MSLTTSDSSLDLPSWLQGRLASFDLRVHDFPTTGRGLQSTIDRASGQVVIEVPEEDAVTATSLLDRYPTILARASHASLEQNDRKLTDEQVLAAGILLLLRDQDRYAASLPKEQYSVLNMPDEMLTFLPVAYQKVIVAYREHCLQLHGSLQKLLQADGVIMDEEEFIWAFATVRSRCVGMTGKEDEQRVSQTSGRRGEIRVLLPGFDLLNHNFGALAVPDFLEETKVYSILSNDAYSRGDQVFISYGEERDNLKMLMTYGFCVPDNPQRLVFFDVHDLLQACAMARPDFFTADVLNQLNGLMQKLGKERDLFLLDGGNQQPRDCLVKGIAMMAELEKQFISEPDDTFRDDVLTWLITIRRQEVSNGLNHFQVESESLKKGHESWISLLSSIVTLLEEELKYLSSNDAA